jgi:putative Mg2+ transporter-C (MgtC) family protein
MDITQYFDLNPSQLKILLYVVISMLLGAVVGLDRELADKPAGLRTHMLVAGSAALLVSVGKLIIPQFGLNDMALGSDPLRIISAIITGVSFLGAGTIIRRGSEDKVKGLTTAAALLFVAAVGICVALSKILLAIGVTIIALATLRGVVYMERKFGFGRREF